VNLGDIVNMPLPTQWAPEIQSWLGPTAPPGGALPFVPAIPGSVTASESPFTAATGAMPGLQVPPTISQPAAGQWSQPHLPDSVLPPALQRNNPLLRRQPVDWRPGLWDMRIILEAHLWSYIKNHGGIKSCCRVPELGAPIYDQPPWVVMPSNARKLEQAFALQVPAQFPNPFTGVDTVLGSFQVPEGWDGVITRFVPNFVGTGFADFSGAIFWRLRINNRYAPDLGNVNSTYGSLTAGFSVPGINNIRLISGQTVYVIASIPVGSPVTAGYVSGIVLGWYWPRR